MNNNKGRNIRILSLSVIMAMSLGIYGCSAKSDSVGSNLPSDSSQTTTESGSSQASSESAAESGGVELTVDELKAFDGQDGQPAYVAVDGIIYDVSETRKWKNGKHENGVVAGTDLTELINASPHGKSILGEAKIVGKIKQ